MSNNDYLNDFTAAAQYIASTLNVTLINNSQSKQCNISGTERDGGKSKGGKDKRNKNTKLTHSYTPEEWRALSPEQRKRVQDARAEAKSKRKQDNKNNPKRVTAAMGSDTPVNNYDGDSDSYIDVHAGNVAEVLRKKNISSVHTEDTGDYMSSRTGNNRQKKSRVSMMSTLVIIMKYKMYSR
jgi:hypothetical protein